MARADGQAMTKSASVRLSGFTLLELMIVVAIVAILMAIAIPSYQKYILRGHRTDATRALQDLASREENYYFSNSTYPASFNSLGATNTTLSGFYLITIPASSATNYKITATPLNNQLKDTTCGALSLDHAGNQTVSGTGSAVTCWQGQ